jgi:hypothetical protein
MNFAEQVTQVFPDWTYGNPMVLYGLIRSMKPAVCVEVGTYLGFGAAWMAQALKENGSGHLYCVDNFGLNDRAIQQGNPRQHLEQNLAKLGLTDWVTILEGDSDKVQWPERCDICYIDGWHSYLAAKHDFEQCAKRGAECVCFDDTTMSVGPRLLTMELRCKEEWQVLDILRDCGMTIAMRRQKKGPITFSQEDPTHQGRDLQLMTKAEQLQHLEQMSLSNGVNYDAITHVLHGGRE